MDVTAISPFMRGFIKPNEYGSISAPKNVLLTVSAAYNQYISLRQDSVGRNITYAAVEGMLGGNPPYNQTDLDNHGLSHIANYNNFKGRSLYERSAQGFWNLINSVSVFVKIILRDVGPNTQKWADIMARHFSDVLKEWEDFCPNYNLLGAQLTKFGVCPIIFPHEESPMWEVIDVTRFYIPPLTQVLTTKLSNVCVESVYTLQELYSIYESTKDKKNSKWNKKALEDFLIYKANVLTGRPGSRPFMDIMELQRAIESQDVFYSTYFTDTVILVNLYQMEYDGKISHYIFSSDFYSATSNSATSNPVPTGTADFLYFFDRQYERLEDAIIIFTASPGEWNIFSNLGVGQKIFPAMQAINMLECNVVDMGKMASTPIVKSMSTGGREISPIRFYPGVPTDIGEAEFIQNNLGANIEQLVVASQYLTASVEMNTVNSGEDPGLPDRSTGSLSPSQARSKDFKEFNVLKNAVAHFYNTFDKPVRLSFIRFLELAARGESKVPGSDLAHEWKRRCLEDGVPESLFDTKDKGLHGLPRQFRSVRASRVAGDGSTLARIMSLESMDRIVPTMNAREMQAYKREWVEATGGPDYVSTFVSDVGEDENISGGASLARTEDNLMSLGKGPLFSPDNDQEAHTDEHMGFGNSIVRAVAQQEMSPVDANKIMEFLVPHLGEHIEFMSAAPIFYQDILNRVEKPFKQLMQWAQLNKKNAQAMVQAAIKEQQENAAQTQQVMDDAERKDFTAKRDADRADFKVKEQVERAKDANKTRAKVMTEKTRADIDIKREKAQADTEIKREATAKGREQEKLRNTPLPELRDDLDSLLGNTPSTVDFEG